jgi:hypothetical protein
VSCGRVYGHINKDKELQTVHTQHNNIPARRQIETSWHQLGILHKLTAIICEKQLSSDATIVIDKQTFHTYCQIY